MRQEPSVLSPTQVGMYIKSVMERDRLLSGILVDISYGFIDPRIIMGEK